MPPTKDKRCAAREQGAIEAAAAALAGGGIVAFPTETFYGLAARPDRLAAVERLAGLKGRPDSIPLIAADAAAAWALAELPAEAEALVSPLWPGPLTLAAPPRRQVPSPVLGHGGTLALRVSSHPIAQRLAEIAGGVVTATSANLRGEPPVVGAGDLAPAILAAVAVVIDGGATRGGLPSTIIGLDRDAERFVIFRSGAVSPAQLAATLGYEPAQVSRA